MIGWLIERVTGKDDLERIAQKGNVQAINFLLKKRPVWIPSRPRQAIDPEGMDGETLVQAVQNELGADGPDAPFVPWIMEVDGCRRLPAFSSMRRAETFVAKASAAANRVLPIQFASVLLWDVTPQLDVEFVDINLFCATSWEIAVRV